MLLLLCAVSAAFEGSSVARVQRRCAVRPGASAPLRTRRPAGRTNLRLRTVRPLRPRRAAPRALLPAAPLAATRGGARPESRLRRFTRWTGRVLSVRGALRGIERAVSFFRPGQRVTDLSASSLTVAGSRSIEMVRPALAAVSGVAGVTLAAASAVELARARTHIERADAAHGIAWGLQSVGGIGGMWWHAPGWAAPAAFGLGLGGGAIQVGVGLYRLKSGLARRDRRSLILGALDTGAGATWIASTVTGNPLTLAAFFGLTGARLLYTNAPRIAALARRAARRVSRVVSVIARVARSHAPDDDRVRLARIASPSRD